LCPPLFSKALKKTKFTRLFKDTQLQGAQRFDRLTVTEAAFSPP
jgi:hypothetical protein